MYGGLTVVFCVGFQIVELPSHQYYVGVQFHPEFKSRPGKPSALFLGMCVPFYSCQESSFDLLE